MEIALEPNMDIYCIKPKNDKNMYEHVRNLRYRLNLTPLVAEA